ncbi:hypothetical protein [Noviherbaspirillum aridicola]|uniref:Uncharacterized protein n=1 Tax=Noviherbaspirillum aridicola TaxID=2849687 RepID=A0ABQ4Q847_9BURK|nr:hypothetical protein [Noviherbaspirillum aridicola]GIZ53370.1 hypothetical protein NCCP691_33840 [Noviherbaspirillum aridicola]
MESIKARISGQGVDSSVEFTVEEAISQYQGTKPWRELSESEVAQALKDYAQSLYARQNGMAGGNLDVRLEGGTLSGVPQKDI